MIVGLKIIYSLFLPPGIFLIALLITAGWSYRRDRSVGKKLFVVAGIFYFLTIGLLANLVVHSLESQYSPPRQPAGDVIIMFGGGATADTPNLDGQGHPSGASASRLLTVAQLYRKLHVPIIISGGQVYDSDGTEAEVAKTILLRLGIPADKIITDDASRNTSENASNCAALITSNGFRHPILVTSAYHMKRSLLQCEKAGMTVVPFPTGYLVNSVYRPDIGDFFPSGQQVDILSIGLKEYLGIAAVRWY